MAIEDDNLGRNQPLLYLSVPIYREDMYIYNSFKDNVRAAILKMWATQPGLAGEKSSLHVSGRDSVFFLRCHQIPPWQGASGVDW